MEGSTVSPDLRILECIDDMRPLERLVLHCIAISLQTSCDVGSLVVVDEACFGWPVRDEPVRRDSQDDRK